MEGEVTFKEVCLVGTRFGVPITQECTDVAAALALACEWARPRGELGKPYALACVIRTADGDDLVSREKVWQHLREQGFDL